MVLRGGQLVAGWLCGAVFLESWVVFGPGYFFWFMGAVLNLDSQVILLTTVPTVLLMFQFEAGGYEQIFCQICDITYSNRGERKLAS